MVGLDILALWFKKWFKLDVFLCFDMCIMCSSTWIMHMVIIEIAGSRVGELDRVELMDMVVVKIICLKARGLD